MTEEEWLQSSSSQEMLKQLPVRPACRRLRLFCVACHRQHLDEFADPRERRAIDVAEWLADGQASEEDLRSTEAGLLDFEDETDHELGGATEFCLFVQSQILMPKIGIEDAISCARVIAYQAAFGEGGFEGLDEELDFDQAVALRDIFGNPFRPVAVDPRWRTSDAVGLARGIYEERAFDRLPLLADALMDAGCADEQVIGHCRSDGVHVRGCWVVDLVLGRE
jgi:hypothetical protein